MEIQEETVRTSSTGDTQQIVQTSETVASPAQVQEAKAYKRDQILWYIVGVINTLLALRILFLLLGAQSSGFTSALYGITAPFIAPFRGIFPAPQIEGSYFDTAALVAIVIYSLLGWGVSALMRIASRPTAS